MRRINAHEAVVIILMTFVVFLAIIRLVGMIDDEKLHCNTIINYRPNDTINLSTIVEVKINRPINYCIPEGENLRCGCGDIS